MKSEITPSGLKPGITHPSIKATIVIHADPGSATRSLYQSAEHVVGPIVVAIPASEYNALNATTGKIEVGSDFKLNNSRPEATAAAIENVLRLTDRYRGPNRRDV
ncbi:MAG: hypothetical protein BroJett004_02250 [Planctomycetota bacterium]|nr:MAG: hypothetical protein BroJett004_02250 [Planctomycetota bacterium]